MPEFTNMEETDLTLDKFQLLLPVIVVSNVVLLNIPVTSVVPVKSNLSAPVIAVIFVSDANK